MVVSILPTRSISAPSLDGMLVHCRVTRNIKLAAIHMYTWVGTGTLRINCLAQEHNTVNPAGLIPELPDPESTAKAWHKALLYIAYLNHPFV